MEVEYEFVVADFDKLSLQTFVKLLNYQFYYYKNYYLLQRKLLSSYILMNQV